jgi:hypothetical protein
MPPRNVEQILSLMKLQYEFARTATGGTATQRLAANSPRGWVAAPKTFPERRTIRIGNSFDGYTFTICANVAAGQGASAGVIR